MNKIRWTCLVLSVGISVFGCEPNTAPKSPAATARTFDTTMPVPVANTVAGTEPVISETILASQRYAAFWNTGMEKYAYEALSPDFKDLNPPEGRKPGIEGVLEASKNFRTAVPNLTAEVKELIVAENKAVVQYQFRGNFTGKMGDKKGNGKAIDFVAVDIYTVKGGKITHNWHLEDYATLFKKIDAGVTH